MGKYEIEIPDYLLIEAGGLLNELRKKYGAVSEREDKFTPPTGETFPVLQKNMTMNDLMVLCIYQSVERYKKILQSSPNAT